MCNDCLRQSEADHREAEAILKMEEAHRLQTVRALLRLIKRADLYNVLDHGEFDGLSDRDITLIRSFVVENTPKGN